MSTKKKSQEQKKSKKEENNEISKQENKEVEAFEILDELHVPEEKKTVLRSAIIQKQFSGPLPPIEEARGYEEILPGSFDRILKMAETVTTSNAKCHEVELEIVKEDMIRSHEESKRGQLICATIIIISLIFGFIGVLLDKDSLWITAFITAASTFCLAFVYGKNNQEPNKNEKKDD